MYPYDPNAQQPTQPWQPGQPPPPPQWTTQYPQPGQWIPQQPPLPYLPPTKPYSDRVLHLFIALYVFFWILCLAGRNIVPIFDLGISLCIGLAGSVLMLDARGIASLQRPRPGNTKTLFSLLALFMWPFWLGIYLLCTYLAYRRPPLATAPIHRTPTFALSVGSGITALFYVLAINGAVTTPPSTASQVATVSSDTTAVVTLATATPAQITVIATKKPMPTPTPGPAQRPVSVPAAQPTSPPRPAAPPPTPKPQPTSPPAPTYNTNASGGQLVYDPPADFCDNNACVSTFWTATSGYVVECASGAYSHSGGVRGACSRNGGVAAILYRHG